MTLKVNDGRMFKDIFFYMSFLLKFKHYMNNNIMITNHI